MDILLGYRQIHGVLYIDGISSYHKHKIILREQASAQFLQIALLYQSFNIALTHIELAVLGEIDRSGMFSTCQSM